MSIDADTRPLALETTTTSAPDINHLVCCDEDLARCGLDVTDEPWNDDPADRCVVCLDLAGTSCGDPDCGWRPPP